MDLLKNPFNRIVLCLIGAAVLLAAAAAFAATNLPTDDDGHAIPAMRLKDGAAHTIATSAVSTCNSTPFDSTSRVVSIYATEDVWLDFGASCDTATSADHYFPAGVYYDIAIGGGKTGHASYVATLRVVNSGTVYISEKE